MGHPKVLIVDDEANARSALTELLRDAGFDVACAASGAEGLALVELFHPDVLLTDARMPGLDALAAEMRARRGPGKPRVVFMSSYVPPVRRSLGGETWLSKPIDLDELLGTIVRLVATPVPA